VLGSHLERCPDCREEKSRREAARIVLEAVGGPVTDPSRVDVRARAILTEAGRRRPAAEPGLLERTEPLASYLVPRLAAATLLLAAIAAGFAWRYGVDVPEDSSASVTARIAAGEAEALTDDDLLAALMGDEPRP
jgi:hypothetical protein